MSPRGKLLKQQINNILIYMSFVFGNICQIMSRHLYSSIQTRLHWDSKIPFSGIAFEKLQFWCFSPLWRVQERIMFTGASNFAGAGILLHSQDLVAHFMFDQTDKKQSFYL